LTRIRKASWGRAWELYWGVSPTLDGRGGDVDWVCRHLEEQGGDNGEEDAEEDVEEAEEGAEEVENGVEGR
jgi:hypothetical protein